MIFEGCGQDNPYPTKQNEKSVILYPKGRMLYTKLNKGVRFKKYYGRRFNII